MDLNWTSLLKLKSKIFKFNWIFFTIEDPNGRIIDNFRTPKNNIDLMHCDYLPLSRILKGIDLWE